MQLHFDEFISGVLEHLNVKTASDIQHEQTINSSIFPTLESQHTWKFAKSHNRLQLHDGNVIHTFTAADNKFRSNEDFPITKIEDTSYFDFEKGMKHSGTAQVHRANPGMLYVTLHDGEHNPTYTLSHVSENSWRASPKSKKKEGECISLANFADGLGEKVSFDIAQALDTAGNKTMDGIRAIGNNPLASAGIGLGIGGAYDLGKRYLYNTEQENEEETLAERATRWLAPAALAGGVGMAERTVIPQHYDGGPLNRAGGVTPDYLPGKDDFRIQGIKNKVGEESNVRSLTADPYKQINNPMDRNFKMDAELAPSAGAPLGVGLATGNNWRMSAHPHLGPFTTTPTAPTTPTLASTGQGPTPPSGPLVGLLSPRGY